MFFSHHVSRNRVLVAETAISEDKPTGFSPRILFEKAKFSKRSEPLLEDLEHEERERAAENIRLKYGEHAQLSHGRIEELKAGKLKAISLQKPSVKQLGVCYEWLSQEDDTCVSEVRWWQQHRAKLQNAFERNRILCAFGSVPDHPLGFVAYNEKYEISAIGVKKEWQRKGIGLFMVKYLTGLRLNTIAKGSVDYIIFALPNSLGFWRRLGFSFTNKNNEDYSCFERPMKIILTKE